MTNKNIKILFLHGKEGTPEGSKPTFLRAKGHWVIAPVLPKDDWGLSIRRAKDCLDAFKPDIVVGSSRGGAIACALETGKTPKILIAPAWKHFDVKNPRVDSTTTILHCAMDDLVKYGDSTVLEETYGCNLVTCGSGHRMSDDHALSHLFMEIKRAVSNAT